MREAIPNIDYTLLLTITKVDVQVYSGENKKGIPTIKQ